MHRICNVLKLYKIINVVYSKQGTDQGLGEGGQIGNKHPLEKQFISFHPSFIFSTSWKTESNDSFNKNIRLYIIMLAFIEKSGQDKNARKSWDKCISSRVK